MIYFGFEIVLAVILSPLADWLRNFVSSIVSGTLTAPFFALVLTVLYFRLSAAAEQAAPAAAAGPAEQPSAETPTEEPPPPPSPPA